MTVVRQSDRPSGAPPYATAIFICTSQCAVRIGCVGAFVNNSSCQASVVLPNTSSIQGDVTGVDIGRCVPTSSTVTLRVCDLRFDQTVGNSPGSRCFGDRIAVSIGCFELNLS